MFSWVMTTMKPLSSFYKSNYYIDTPKSKKAAITANYKIDHNLKSILGRDIFSMLLFKVGPYDSLLKTLMYYLHNWEFSYCYFQHPGSAMVFPSHIPRGAAAASALSAPKSGTVATPVLRPAHPANSAPTGKTFTVFSLTDA